MIVPELCPDDGLQSQLPEHVTDVVLPVPVLPVAVPEPTSSSSTLSDNCPPPHAQQFSLDS